MQVRMEDLGHGAAGAEAGWYGGEGRDHEDRTRHHGEQLPERRDGVVESGSDGGDQGDASRDAQEGADERGKHLRRRQACADLLRGRAERARQRRGVPGVERRRPGDEDGVDGREGDAA